MSGIVCLFNLDQAPVDGQALQRMTEFQAFRGPDAQRVWLNGHIGLGHTLLKTTEESEQEEQPLSLDGKVWIVADARIDGQRDLIAGLQAHGQEIAAGATDAEIILRAYHAWGQSCTEHLLGDFAFVIWDQGEGLLFCARDQIGVKQVFYAQVNSSVVISNSLDCIRRHPAVSNRLDDQAIAEFLVFEILVDPGRTSFADIRRLPGGHSATWTAAGPHVRRYWTLPIDEPVFYRRADDYLDRFRELLKQAVADRLRTNRIGIFMSGGLDSTTIAATAHQILRGQAAQCEVRAFTVVDETAPDERHYAGLVADRLGIPIQYFDWDGGLLNPHWEQTPFHTPEPDGWLIHLQAYQQYWQRIGSCSRVFMQGEGADNALEYEWRRHLAYLYRRRHYAGIITALCSDLWARPRLPFLGRIHPVMRRLLSTSSSQPYIPWLNPDLESKLQMRARWDEFVAGQVLHSVRPSAYEMVTGPHFRYAFEFYDAERTRAPFEVRHPFVDLRLMRFLLAVPTMPWCRSKYLLRCAMKGILPEPVRRRPKTSGIPCALAVERCLRLGVKPFVPALEFGSYVDLKRLPQPPGDNPEIAHNCLRARILNHWMRYSLKLA